MITNYLCTISFKEVPQLVEQRFRDRASPTNMTIRKNVKKYLGSSSNLNQDRSGHRRANRTMRNNNLLQENLIEDPRTSARKNGLDISMYTFNRITELDLKWHLYKMYVRKEGNNYK